MSGQNYRAVAEGSGAMPTFVSSCASAHDAAQSFAASYVEDMQGDWTEGVVKVWRVNDDYSDDPAVTFFDVKATITPYEGDDAEEGEVECELEVTERE